MTETTYAINVKLIHQGHENHCTKEWRCEVKDPYTNVTGVGYGESERESFNDAKVDFQDNAASLIRMALREADEGFARTQTLSAPVLVS